jgi:exonuclease SbcC
VQELGTVDRTAAQQDAQLAEVRRQLADLPAGYDAERHRRVRTDVDGLAASERDRMRAEATVARAAQAAAARERAVAELTRAEARAADVRARLAAEPLDEGAVARVRAEYEQATAAARAAEVRVAQAAGERAAARGAIEQAERARAEFERVRVRVEELGRERLALDELDRAYTDLRTDLNFQLRPELSETASRFLADLTEGRYDALELDDQYNVVVHEDGAPKPVISGGEEDLANLVLRLAISQMIAERAGQSFSLLVLDEVFGSLDESRRANVVELLRRLHDRFEQVIVITHIEDVREGLDRVVRVRYDAARGTSVVEQEDSVAAVAPADALADPFAVGAPAGVS